MKFNWTRKEFYSPISVWVEDEEWNGDKVNHEGEFLAFKLCVSKF